MNKLTSNKYLNIAIFLLAIITVACFILFNFNPKASYDYNKSLIDNNFEVDLPEDQNKPSGISIYDGSERYYFNQGDSRKSFDCSTNKSGCIERNLNKTYLECKEMYPVIPNISKSCVTSSDSDGVTLKAEKRINHVTAPLTRENYNVIDHQKLVGGFEFINPWDLKIINQDRFLVTGSDGQIFDMRRSEGRKYKDLKIYRINVKKSGPGATQWSPYTGLKGVALDPNFSENNQIYLYYSYKSENVSGKEVVLSKVAKFKINREKGEINKIKTLIDSIPGRMYYQGGRIEFGPDEKHLYITTGSAIFEKAQDKDFLGGKILRLNSNGSIPYENPYNNSVYASGLRNPQGIDFNPETNQMVISQHGPWRRDNIAKIGKGTNMNWPDPCRKSHPNPEVGESILCTQTWTLAPSGITFVDNRSHPWNDSLFITGLNGNHLHRLRFNEKKPVSNEVFWFNGYRSKAYPQGNRLRDVEYANGELWILRDHNYITKLSPTIE